MTTSTTVHAEFRLQSAGTVGLQFLGHLLSISFHCYQRYFHKPKQIFCTNIVKMWISSFSAPTLLSSASAPHPTLSDFHSKKTMKTLSSFSNAIHPQTHFPTRGRHSWFFFFQYAHLRSLPKQHDRPYKPLSILLSWKISSLHPSFFFAFPSYPLQTSLPIFLLSLLLPATILVLDAYSHSSYT